MAQRRRIYHSHEYQHHGPVGLTAAYLKAGPVPVWGGSPRVWFLVQYNNFTFARMGIPFSGEHNPSMRRPISSTILKPGTWLLILHGAALWSRYLKASQQTICLPEAHQSLRGPHGWSCRLVSVHVVLGVAFSGFDFFTISQSARLHFLSIISKNKIRDYLATVLWLRLRLLPAAHIWYLSEAKVTHRSLLWVYRLCCDLVSRSASQWFLPESLKPFELENKISSLWRILLSVCLWLLAWLLAIY